MKVKLGQIFKYLNFQNNQNIKNDGVTIWPSGAIEKNISQEFDAITPGMSLLTLSKTDDLKGCDFGLGLSVSFQVLRPGISTPFHAHEWWHLFIVMYGSGSLSLSGDEIVKISESDILYISSYCYHLIHNNSDNNLCMINLSNMKSA